MVDEPRQKRFPRLGTDRYVFVSYLTRDREKITNYVKALADAKVPMFVDAPHEFGIDITLPQYSRIYYLAHGDYETNLQDLARSCSLFLLFASKGVTQASKTFEAEIKAASRTGTDKIYPLLLEEDAKLALKELLGAMFAGNFQHAKLYGNKPFRPEDLVVHAKDTLGANALGANRRAELQNIPVESFPYRVNRDGQVNAFSASLKKAARAGSGRRAHQLYWIDGLAQEEHHRLTERFQNEIAPAILNEYQANCGWKYLDFTPLATANTIPELDKQIDDYCQSQGLPSLNDPKAFSAYLLNRRSPLALLSSLSVTPNCWTRDKKDHILYLLSKIAAVEPQAFPAMLSLTLVARRHPATSGEHRRCDGHATQAIEEIRRRMRQFPTVDLVEVGELKPISRDDAYVFCDREFRGFEGAKSIVSATEEIFGALTTIPMRVWGKQFSEVLSRAKSNEL